MFTTKFATNIGVTGAEPETLARECVNPQFLATKRAGQALLTLPLNLPLCNGEKLVSMNL